ncbi:hypothetical protein IM660_00515 [Ruania alkalisoli]|uniref:Uncharacterized protein n=2 Tax=Ruania alkalisoli TaxID=2779775 RepID=A0A7M1SY57_9MICO|nr:hypothetical protein IM660_00515 [Ruania alkalisoli]
MSDAERADQFLDNLDPDVTPADDPSELRRIGLALRDIEASQNELRDAVAAARTAGRSWSQIGMVLGVSKQSAQERFGTRAAAG